jgi:ribosomal protein S18 acetylase RimI-like enzyme
MKDPLQIYTFPDEEERRQKSPDHFAAILRYGLLFGEVYSSNNMEGAVVWLKPGQTEVTPEKAAQGSLTELPQLLGEEAATRFFSVLEYIEPYHQQDAPEPHWYTMVVGVDPAFARKGIGTALLQPVLDKARQNRQPVYLETAQPDNIGFYTKLGFSVVRELKEPVSGLALWTFKLDH